MLILANKETKKVGYVLLQAIYGTDYQKIPFDLWFPVETWELIPSENLIVVKPEELQEYKNLDLTLNLVENNSIQTKFFGLQ